MEKNKAAKKATLARFGFGHRFDWQMVDGGRSERSNLKAAKRSKVVAGADKSRCCWY